jgi:hypothetical protein
MKRYFLQLVLIGAHQCPRNMQGMHSLLKNKKKALDDMKI